jgi:hypothetical protein
MKGKLITGGVKPECKKKKILKNGTSVITCIKADA